MLFRSRPSRLAKKLKDYGPSCKTPALLPMLLKPMFFQDRLVITGCALVRLTLERKPGEWGRTCGAAFHERYLISGSNPI